jgi:hypothetical protein
LIVGMKNGVRLQITKFSRLQILNMFYTTNINHYTFNLLIRLYLTLDYKGVRLSRFQCIASWVRDHTLFNPSHTTTGNLGNKYMCNVPLTMTSCGHCSYIHI